MARAKVRFTNFVPNPPAIARFESSAIVTAAVVSVAEKVARRAERNGGRFTKGYEGRALGGGKARAGTDYPFAHWDEWGNVYRPPRAPLRRALSELGLSDQTDER